MTDAMWNALALVLVGALGLIGTIVNKKNVKSAAEKAADKVSSLTLYRIGQLEAKQDKHNAVIERTFLLEKGQAVLCQRLDDLEKKP